MPTVINTNLASLFAQNSLSNAQNNLATSVQRLSSGLRINSAKDDAAGLSISQNMQGQINGVNQSVRNLSDATNLIQVADSSLSTVQDMLLRMKQLAVQGYDGSLSATQKLNIVQELKDLNTEINATAARTSFNGINLLTSGSSVDLNNSDLKAGEELTTSAVTLSGVAASLGTFVGVAVSGAPLVTSVASVTGGTKLESVAIDNDYRPRLGSNTYNFSANGNQLTVTGTIDGLQRTQTVTVRDTIVDSTTAITDSQSLNFSNFGITLNLTTSVLANVVTTGSSIATGIAAKLTAGAQFSGKVGVVSDVRLSGVAAGTYSLTAGADASKLKLAGTVNGVTTSQEVQLTDNAANATQTIKFDAFGVQFDVKSYQAQINTELVTAIRTLAGGSGSPAGVGMLVVSGGANSALKFQSGANTEAFIQIDTINIGTSSTGAFAGTDTNMINLGTRVTSSTAGSIGALGLMDSIDTWQTAFKNVADAVDKALETMSTSRAVYGSQMNRLSYISNNLQAQSTNLQNSRSAIIDTDFAAETARLTKGQIMQQAATAMLAQANQMPNVILSLLK
jgi:flagellin